MGRQPSGARGGSARHLPCGQYSNRPRYTEGVARLPPSDVVRTLGQLSTVGLSFVLALVMGFGAGLWLDRQLDTSPWLTLAGFGVGLAAGVLNVVRILSGIQRMEDAHARRKPDARRDESPGERLP
jgi:ATP synthase protein I